MKAKQFTLLFLFSSIGLYLVLYLIYTMVNPEQIYNHSITSKKFFYTKAYSRKQYEALKTGHHTLIFGTSQIHRISSKILGKPVLNFHNLYGEPGDILNFLHQLSQEQIAHIDEIFYCIDLSAKAGRKEGKLIDYGEEVSYFTPLTLTKVSRTFTDIWYNIRTTKGYLNHDGSNEYLDVNQSTHIRPFPYELNYPYHTKLIDEILKINQFAKIHHKKIVFFTPVTSDAFFRSINFKHLQPFFSTLLNGGIEAIGMYYFIPGISDLKNSNGLYLAFMDETHLNVHYVMTWSKEYILNPYNPYIIHSEDELNRYIKTMTHIQKQYKNQ